MTAAQLQRPTFVAWRVGRGWSRWHLAGDARRTACGVAVGLTAGFTTSTAVPTTACHSCVAAALDVLEAGRPADA